MSGRAAVGRFGGARGLPAGLAAPALAGLALALVGCGAQPPQAPTHQASRAASAMTGIEEACGLAYQARGPRGASGEPAGPAAEAQSRALELASVYRLNPEWIYNGVTLRAIVALSVRDLRECGLGAAASELLVRTRR
jgi:hypothetical protein